MPVYKYKTFEEADRALWDFHPDEAYFRKVADLWNFAGRLLPISYPKGIFKFRSMEEANKHRDQLELEHAKKNYRRKGVQPARSKYTYNVEIEDYH